MKTLSLCLIACFILLMSGLQYQAQAQVETDDKAEQMYLVIKNDGTRYICKIISRDAREVLIETKELGQIVIPMHEIKEIRMLKDEEVNDAGDLRLKSAFATRYYFSSNARPISKGDNYIIWNLYGPDIQFGVGENFGVGLLTTWFGSPIVGSLKYSIVRYEKLSIALGSLVGTGSWATPEYGFALPFGAISLGEAEKNLTVSVGHGIAYGDGQSSGNTLISIAGMSRFSPRVSFVIDSFIVTGKYTAAIIIPAIRLHSKPNKAFQIGFAGIAAEGELIPIPFPFIQWYRTL